MDQISPPTLSRRDQWLALLNKNGVGHPKEFHVVELPGSLVQATIGEPPGHMCIDGAPANVLMFNLSPVQALRQRRNGRTFVSDMLQGEMTLMPFCVPSEWSWNSACDRLDMALSPDILGDENSLEAVDRFLFRDEQIGVICQRLYQEVSCGNLADHLHMESLVMQMAMLLHQRHSCASRKINVVRSSGLTRSQTRRVLEYVEANLSRQLTLQEMSNVVDLSPYHFARMFKQMMKTAPHSYVLGRRIERAKTMLRTTGASLIDISLSTGFCNQSHFSSTFSRMVGMTPSRFQTSTRPLRVTKV